MTYHEQQLQHPIRCTPEQIDALEECVNTLYEMLDVAKEASRRRFEGYEMLYQFRSQIETHHNELLQIIFGCRDGMIKIDTEGL